MILKLKYLLLPSTILNSKQNLNTLNNITSTITISEFHLKDHLGNTRVTVDNTGKKVQTNNYYLFGMTFASSGTTDNKYLYNGKEPQEETDCDFGRDYEKLKAYNEGFKNGTIQVFNQGNYSPDEWKRLFQKLFK